MVNTFRQGKTADLEQAWRPLIPVDSFTRQPAEIQPTPAAEPFVGIRWGKPADFEFDLGERKPKNDVGDTEIRNAEIVYETVEIVGSNESFRKFREGRIREADAEYDAEDTREWLFDANTSHSFPTKDIWFVEYNRTVNVHFNFKLTGGGQVIFLENQFTNNERGTYPEGDIWTGVEILE